MPEGENFFTKLRRNFNRRGPKASQEVQQKTSISDEVPVEKYIVSNRKYEEVFRDLRIPEGYFSPESMALSIGEGLSDFASILHQKGIRIVALDPLYSIGKELFGKSISSAKEIIRKWYGGKVGFRDYWHGERTLSQPEEPLISGSVYSMPFPDGSFTHIFGHKIFEHINLSQALPEMVRVLKKGGEIRLGGVLLSAKPEEGKLLTGILQYDGYEWGLYLSSANDIKKAFSKLSMKGDLLGIYVIIDGVPWRSEVREDTGAFIAGVMVIRKDSITPSYLPFSGEEKIFAKTGEKYPLLGRMYKVDFSNFILSQDYGGGYYKLTLVRES